jgi:hypothetical protein
MIENVPVSNLEIKIAGVESIQQIVPQMVRTESPESPRCGMINAKYRGFNTSQNNCESGEWRTLGFPLG